MKKLLQLFGFLFLVSCNLTNSNDSHSLTITVDPVESGSVTPIETTFNDGELIELVANPNEHWLFDRWSGDFNGTSNPLPITITRDLQITAHFIKREYPLQVIVEGEGTYTEEIIQQSSIQTDYVHGTMIRLTASPTDGWQVGFWGGDVEGNESSIEVLVDGPTTIRLGFYEAPLFELLPTVEHSNAFYSLLRGRVINKEGINYDGMGNSHYTVGLVWDVDDEIDTEMNEGIYFTNEGNYDLFKMENLDPEGRYFARLRAENQFGVYYSDAVEVNVPKYNYGGVGQAGGTIFFIDEDNEYSFDYLEVAPPGWHSSAPDGDPEAAWGCSGVRIFTNDNQPSRANGLESTRFIADNCDEEGIAVKLVLDYNINGYTDWYLPTSLDSHEYYVNTRDLPVPAKPGSMVTLSENSPTEYYIHGTGRVPSSILKTHQVEVRPIRAFSD